MWFSGMRGLWCFWLRVGGFWGAGLCGARGGSKGRQARSACKVLVVLEPLIALVCVTSVLLGVREGKSGPWASLHGGPGLILRSDLVTLIYFPLFVLLLVYLKVCAPLGLEDKLVVC